MDQGASHHMTFDDSDIPQRQAAPKSMLDMQQQDTHAVADQGIHGNVAGCDQKTADNGQSDALNSGALSGLINTAATCESNTLLLTALSKGSPQAKVDSSSSSSSVCTQDAGSEDSSAACTSNAHDPQICFDFTKGLCTRGDKCKYSHDIATIVQFNSKEKGICFDYLRNQCHRGLLCRFSHDLSNIAQQCQTFNGGGAMATKNRSGSICYDFVKGVCTRGADCRYSHDLTLIARMARTSSGGAVDADQAPGQQTDVCFDFLRGRCSRGDACKYSHNANLLSGCPGLAPGFLPGTLGSPGVLDPSLAAPWPLMGLNPQTAAAAAAAAAAYAAAGSPTANLGNVMNRLGMLGLGAADPTAAAAAAAAVAAFAGQAGALNGMPAATAGLGPLGAARPPGFDASGINKMGADNLSRDALAMFMAMQQQGNSLLAPGATPNLRPGSSAAGPLLPPLSLPPKIPHAPLPTGQPTPEQMMMANAEISRMLEKSQQAAAHGQSPKSLLMQQQLLAGSGLTSGLPAPHLASTPLSTGDMNMPDLRAAAAMAAVNSSPMAATYTADYAAMHAAVTSGLRPGMLQGSPQAAASAGMPGPGSLAGAHQRRSRSAHPPSPFQSPSIAQKLHGGSLPTGIAASRSGSDFQAAAAAAIAAVASQGSSGAVSPHADAAGPTTDSQGNILPLSRLQEIWSR